MPHAASLLRYCPLVPGLALLLLASPALAQTDAAAPADAAAPPPAASAGAALDPVVAAREHFDTGLAALDRRDFATAIRELERSYQLRRSHIVSADLARAYAGAGSLLEAREAFNRAIAEGQGRWAADALSALRDDVARVEAQLGRLRLRFVDAAARVRVDGHDVENPREPVWLLPGSHRVTITREGYVALQRHVELLAGQQEGWDVQMERVPPPPSSPEEAARRQALLAGSHPVPAWAIGLGIAGGLGVLSAIITGAVLAPHPVSHVPTGTWTPTFLVIPLR